MLRQYHIPTEVHWRDEPGLEARRRLERTILGAIERAITAVSVTDRALSVAVGGFGARRAFQAEDDRPGDETYTVPSFADGGKPTQVPVLRGDQRTRETRSKPEQTEWTEEEMSRHILATFGTYGPQGRTYYGVQTPAGVLVVIRVVNDRPQVVRAITWGAPDVRGHWAPIGEERYFPPGRYIIHSAGKAAEKGAPGRYLATVTDVQGQPMKAPPIYTENTDFRIVFDVPQTPETRGETAPSSVTGPEETLGGAGILPGGQALILFQCHPSWNTDPLTNPAYAGMRDDDLFRLFLNLCNSRAIENLDLSERYIREKLLPRYTGPGGAIHLIHDYSVQNIEHLKEDLRLLRGMMLALHKAWGEIKAIEVALDDLVLRHHPSSRRYRLPLGPSYTVEVGPPIYGPPAPRDRERAETLDNQLRAMWQSARSLIAGIMRLVRDDPLLTQFIEGLDVSAGVPEISDPEKVKSELADLISIPEAQKRILDNLNGIVFSIARARDKLCTDHERILDVPLVYEAVQQDLKGINPRFDEVVAAGVERHLKQQAWTDCGLSFAGLLLFVGGLVLSLAGGPAGVIALLTVSGTVVSGAQAMRSLERASFETALSEAALERGRGLFSLEAAREARFWAAMDAALLAVDVGVQAVQAARGVVRIRQAMALAELAEGSEEFGEALAVGERLSFDVLMAKVTRHSRLNISDAEIAQFKALEGSLSSQAARKMAGQITEEIVQRTLAATGEYVPLATKYGLDWGIDLLAVRRVLFEQVFGKLEKIEDASRVLAQATDRQLQELGTLLRRHPENMISIEAKFSRTGELPEELLKRGRGSIQQHRDWYTSLLQGMRTADPEVRSTGLLIEEVIGTSGQDIRRLTRVGISMDAQGAFKMTHLNEEIINKAHQSAALYRARSYSGMGQGLLEAERAGKVARVQRLRVILQSINRQVAELDTAVRRAKEAEQAAKRLCESLEYMRPLLAQVDTLQSARRTEATLQALHVANNLVRTHLQVARYALDEAESAYDDAQSVIVQAEARRPPLQAELEVELIAWESEEPGIRDRLLGSGNE